MKKYLITGATGYIGSMLTKRLMKEPHNEDISITAVVRNQQKAENMLPNQVHLIKADITDSAVLGRIAESFDYLIHCASVTQSSRMVAEPVETTEGIVQGTKNVLELARRCKVKKTIYLSSMEVYGVIDCSDGHRVTEEELGNVDIFNVRSCYPLGKRMAENLCYSYYKEYGLQVTIARLAQTFGHGIAKEETRVFAQILKSIQTNQDIVLHTAGNSMGNYCGIEDTLDAILLLLLRGEPGEAYNVVNEASTMTIRQMAELAAGKVAGGRIRVVVQQGEAAASYAADTGLRLSAKKLRGLGWSPKVSLEEMYRQML